MAEYIDVAQLFKCETCYHMGSDGKCNSHCESSESYRPAYSKLKKADVVEVQRGYWDGDVCSECGAALSELMDADSNYAIGLNINELVACPFCGARMEIVS